MIKTTFAGLICFVLILSVNSQQKQSKEVADGQAHYEANCMPCHQREGAGLAGLAPSIGNRDFLALADNSFIERVVLEGRPGTAMVPRTDLKGKKLNNIIAYLRSLPVVNPIKLKVDNSIKFKGNSANGKTLFKNFCSSCHGPKGEGYTMAGPGPGIGLAGFLNQASDDFILQTLKHGRSGTAMRGFIGAEGLGNLSVQDAKDVIVYLRTLASSAPAPVAKGPGAKQYTLCVSCHGVHAEGNINLKAPRLGGLPAEYIVTQLKNFKAGLRGYHKEDINSITMKNMANLVKTEDDMKAVANYIKTLNSPAPPKTVTGDIAKGKVAYMACMACHGPKGEGNPALKSPSILGLNDWYIVEQLKKFKLGHRGTKPGDVGGALMRPMSMAVPNEQAMKDLAVYIDSLSKEKK